MFWVGYCFGYSFTLILNKKKHSYTGHRSSLTKIKILNELSESNINNFHNSILSSKMVAIV